MHNKELISTLDNVQAELTKRFEMASDKDLPDIARGVVEIASRKFNYYEQKKAQEKGGLQYNTMPNHSPIYM